MDYSFSATRGPVVKVDVQGANLDHERIERLVPIFEEGSVDEDLLNDGNRRLRDYFQRLGYFDARVDHERQSTGSSQVSILYTVQLGTRRRVDKVSITGNQFFSTATLMDLLSVHAAARSRPPWRIQPGPRVDRHKRDRVRVSKQRLRTGQSYAGDEHSRDSGRR